MILVTGRRSTFFSSFSLSMTTFLPKLSVRIPPYSKSQPIETVFTAEQQDGHFLFNTDKYRLDAHVSANQAIVAKIDAVSKHRTIRHDHLPGSIIRGCDAALRFVWQGRNRYRVKSGHRAGDRRSPCRSRRAGRHIRPKPGAL